jgi:hypothetical protein
LAEDPTAYVAGPAMAGPTRPVCVCGESTTTVASRSDLATPGPPVNSEIYAFGFSRMTSTRRFFARPAEVLLSAMGRSCPMPWARI